MVEEKNGSIFLWQKKSKKISYFTLSMYQWNIPKQVLSTVTKLDLFLKTLLG